MKPIFKYPELFSIPEVPTVILDWLQKNYFKTWKKIAVNAADTMGRGNPTQTVPEVRLGQVMLIHDLKVLFLLTHHLVPAP